MRGVADHVQALFGPHVVISDVEWSAPRDDLRVTVTFVVPSGSGSQARAHATVRALLGLLGSLAARRA